MVLSVALQATVLLAGCTSADDGGALGEAVVQTCPLSTAAPLEHEGDSPLRRDLTDGVVGQTLQVRITVVDANAACAPLPGLTVQLWGANPDGAVGAAHRGRQRTNSAGIVSFRTVVPGAEGGRPRHLHVRVLDGDRSIHVGTVEVTSGAETSGQLTAVLGLDGGA